MQMQAYITVRGFQCKRNKKGEEYGWAVGLYSLSEKLFGEDYVRSDYNMPSDVAKDKIISHLREVFSNVSYEEALKSFK
jgi:hypothetical protein